MPEPRASTPPLPLSDRLPNPPASFVGRGAELRFLRAAIRRAPVTVIRGAAGVGKSTVALAALRRFDGDQVARTVYVPHRHSDPHEPIALPLVRALLRARGARDVDWRELVAAPDGLGALAIDLAEGAELWVVLDDLDRAPLGGPPAETHELLRTLARYARRSRFVVTMREAPRVDELAGQLLELGPMPAADRARLARLVGPTRTPEGARLLAAAASHLADEGAPIEVRLAAAAQLVDGSDPELRIAALRAFASAGRADELHLHLERACGPLLAGGFAPALWAIVADAVDPRIEPVRLRIALELGDRDALARVRAPESTRAEDRLLWAAALIAKSRFAEAAEVAREVGAAQSDASATALRAELLVAQATANLGRLDEALAILDRLDPEHGDAQGLAQRDAMRAQLASLLLREEVALAHVDRARRGLGALAAPERAAVGVRLARALYNVCRFRDATRILDQVSAGDAPGSVRFDVGRTLRFMHACLAHDLGELDRARAELDALEPYVGKTSPLRANVENARGALAAVVGDMEALDRALAGLRSLELPPHLALERTVLDLRARLLRRAPADAPRDRDRDGEPPSESIFARLASLHRLRLDLHVGARAPHDVLAELSALPAHHEERVLARTIVSEARLAGGDAARANVDATAAIDDAEEHELAVHAVEALAVRCDALAVLGDLEALAGATRALAAKAAAMPSSRLSALARLHDALARPIDPAALAAFGVEPGAPEASLRARALLVEGAPIGVPVGVIDRVVLDAFRARTGWTPPRVVDASREAPDAFGIDLARRSVWFSSGARVDFSRHPLLFRILERLAARRGSATKEQLVVEVWGERSYHPLRHDNRLHAAIRKLRKQLGDDAHDSRWIVTTEEGYALGRGAQVVGTPFGTP